MKYAIGLDPGGTNLAAGLVDENFALLATGSLPTLAQRPWQEIVADMAALALRLVEEAGLDKADCVGVGVGCPGTCNAATGEVVYSNNLPWQHVPLGSEITRLTGLPCRISNDANCAALGEVAAGAAKGCASAVLLTLGTGVGTGIILNGQIWEGVDSAGAEFGHSILVADGVLCTCGRRGCVESYASATALIRQAQQATAAHPESALARAPKLDAQTVYALRDAGDAAARAVTDQYERWLGEAVVNAVNIFRPEMVLIGGGVSGRGKALTDPLNEMVRAHSFGGDLSYLPPVAVASLGNRAGIIGAAALCLRSAPTAPLRLAPAFKDYLWGGARLREEFGKDTPLTPLAESWEVSCHPDGPCRILGGDFGGKTLAEYLAQHPGAMGSRFGGGEFPLLIKFIDAAQSLSIQVHPDDAYARRVEGEQGKNEMWYVVDAAPGAFLYYGFKGVYSKEEVRRRIEENTLLEILNAVPVKPGDVFYIQAGTLHAVGAGLLIAEIQQNSNSTYRVYDFGRLGADGKPRALHLDKALDVLQLCPPAGQPGPMGQPQAAPWGEDTLLVECPYFTTRRLRIKGCADLDTENLSFHALVCLSGSGAVIAGDSALPLRRGESVFLPADLGAYRLAGQLELLQVTL